MQRSHILSIDGGGTKGQTNRFETPPPVLSFDIGMKTGQQVFSSELWQDGAEGVVRDAFEDTEPAAVLVCNLTTSVLDYSQRACCCDNTSDECSEQRRQWVFDLFALPTVSDSAELCVFDSPGKALGCCCLSLHKNPPLFRELMAATAA